MSKYDYQINNLDELRGFFKSLSTAQVFPLRFTIDDEPKDKRSTAQNRLQRKWMLELERQGDMSAEDYRAYCKLHIGVPILRNQEENFKARYDQVFRPLDYTTKINLMKVPFDFPVTRLMNKKQKTQYLDAVYQHFADKGFVLTRPDDLMYENEVNV